MCPIKQVYGECSPELCINEKPTQNDCYCVRRNGLFQCPGANCPRGFERNQTTCRCERAYRCSNGDIVEDEKLCPFECEDGTLETDPSNCKENLHQCNNGTYVYNEADCEENQTPAGICDFFPACDNSNFDRDPRRDCDCHCMQQCKEDEILLEDQCTCFSCPKNIKCPRTQKLNKRTCECEQRTPAECNI